MPCSRHNVVARLGSASTTNPVKPEPNYDTTTHKPIT